MKIENMIAKKVRVTLDRGCILSCWIDLEGEGCGVGFGGYALDNYDRAKDVRVGTDYGAEYIRRLMVTLGVESLRAIDGMVVRVRWSGDGSWGNRIEAIGHPVKDQWFDPKKLAEEMGCGDA